MDSPPPIRVKRVVVRPIPTFSVTARISQNGRGHRRPHAGRAMASTQAQAATEAATPPEEAHTEDSRAESRVQAEEDVVVASGGTRSRGAGKNVTIDFPANDPSGRKQFVGAVKMGKPHGQGVLVWESGSRYEGQFRRGASAAGAGRARREEGPA